MTDFVVSGWPPKRSTIFFSLSCLLWNDSDISIFPDPDGGSGSRSGVAIVKG